MDLIIWCAGATVLGAFLGYLGYLHSKLAYTIFTTCLTIIVFMSSQIIMMTGGDVVALAQIQSETGHIAAVPLVGHILRAVNAMGFLPFHVQVAILVFAVTFFLSRIVTWWLKTYGPKKPEETPEERRKRILRGYGMKSMEELRNRY